MSNVITICTLLVTIMITGYGLVYSKHIGRGLFNELQAQQQRQDELEMEWESLLLEQSTRASELAVDRAARDRLQMRMPQPDEVIYITR